jgi:hypothetical protein
LDELDDIAIEIKCVQSYLHIFPKQHRNNRSCIFATVTMNEKIFHKNCHTEGHFFLSFENNTVRINLFRTRFSDFFTILPYGKWQKKEKGKNV